MAIINGTAGNDNLLGTNDDDTISGLDGADIIRGGQGDDTLIGGAGNDFFIWNVGDGNDTVDGGDDFDTQRYNLTNGEGIAVTLEDNGTSLDAFSPLFTTSLTSVERVVISGLDGDDSRLG